MFSFSGVALIGPSGRNCDVDCTSLVSGSLNNMYLSAYQTATVPTSLGSSHIREQILKTGLSLTVMLDGGISRELQLPAGEVFDASQSYCLLYISA